MISVATTVDRDIQTLTEFTDQASIPFEIFIILQRIIIVSKEKSA